MAKQFIKPLKITDDFYWVGVDGSSPAHLLVTDEGLVLIDTASHTNVEEFLANIASLGFDVRDVKHIIHSHGHYDHVGATSRIVKLSGAKTYIGARDADAVRGKNKRLWASLSLPENASEFYFEPDALLRDGDVLRFGKHEFRFLETPGHTEGVLSIFWNVFYKGKSYLAGMFGGAGTAAISAEHLDRDGLPYTLREDYVRSVERILDEPVELHVGNHPGNNKHNDKAERLTEDYNPFIEENTWVPFLLGCRDEVAEKYNIEKRK